MIQLPWAMERLAPSSLRVVAWAYLISSTTHTSCFLLPSLVFSLSPSRNKIMPPNESTLTHSHHSPHPPSFSYGPVGLPLSPSRPGEASEKGGPPPHQSPPPPLTRSSSLALCDVRPRWVHSGKGGAAATRREKWCYKGEPAMLWKQANGATNDDCRCYHRREAVLQREVAAVVAAGATSSRRPLVGSVTRYFRRLCWGLEVRSCPWPANILPPFHQKCLTFIKIWIYPPTR
jgi:hypothetical protein